MRVWRCDKRQILAVAGVCAVALMMGSTAWADEDKEEDGPEGADEIIDRALEINTLGFESGRAQVDITIFDRQGERQERKMDVRSRRDDDRGRTVMTLTDPGEVRGQAFLFIENEDADDDMWMYVPAFEVTRRVEGSQRQSSFMGTHFTFADLESRDLREASYRQKDDGTIGDYDVYVIEARPDTPEESDYERVVAYVRQDDYIPIRVRYYDTDGDLDKTLFTERLNTTGDDDTYIERSTLRSETGGYTTIEIQELDTDVDLPMSLFDREEFAQ